MTAILLSTSGMACWSILAIPWRMKTTPSGPSGRGSAFCAHGPAQRPAGAAPGGPLSRAAGDPYRAGGGWGGGGRRRQEPLALGETPNLAARLQGLAAPNTLVISAATWQLLGGFFACQALGPVRLKAAPSRQVYQVLSETTARSRLEAAKAPA